MALHSDKPWEIGDFCIYPLALPSELENDQLRLHIADMWCGPAGRDHKIALAIFFFLIREAAKRGLKVNEQISLEEIPNYRNRINDPLFKKWMERINNEKEIQESKINNAIRFDWHGVHVTPLKKEVADAARKIFPGFDPEAAQRSIREWMDKHTIKIGDKDPDWGWASRTEKFGSKEEFKAWEKRRWNETFPQYGGDVEVG